MNSELFLQLFQGIATLVHSDPILMVTRVGLMILGMLLAAGQIPQSWAIGDGKYALLLGVNLYGLLICVAGFLLPVTLQRLRAK